MAAGIYLPSRPTTTEDLVHRLKKTSNEKEKKALEALVSRMVELFKDNQKDSFMIEASVISDVASKQDCRDLAYAFSEAIISGTADEKLVNPTLLLSFASCLSHTKYKIPKEIAQSAAVLHSLSKQLKSATNGGQPQDQYFLLCMIGNVLDAMVDMGFCGIDREERHKPLLDQLYALTKSDEPRTAQAARYSHQALLKVPDNESPWGAFCRNSWSIIKATTKVASAVSLMDPGKLVEAAPNLEAILEFFKEIGDTVDQLYNLSKDGKDALLEGMNSVSKTQGWYATLRYTDMLIKARAFSMLNSLLCQNLCVEEEPFFCGLYAQLEQAWYADISSRRHIENLIQSMVSKSENYKLQTSKWINILAEATGKQEWKVQEKKARFFKLNFHRKKGQAGLKLNAFNGNQLITGKPRNLLNEAWESCQKAKLFYADVAIAKYYTEKGRLSIIRLTGDLLPMEKCYVNLAIIEPSTGVNAKGPSLGEKQVSELSITRRLKVETVNTENEVDLPRLFDERRVGNRTIVPRRILIRGRAGVGKSTLCKKIVHDFIHGKIWTKRFDRILWIPLRSLRTQHDPERFIFNEFLSQKEGKRLYSSALEDVIWRQAKESKTLFLLDGLDEVLRVRTERGVGLPTQIERLLNYPNVLLTSRPYGINIPGLQKFDLEVETVGFRPGQVKAYLSMVVADQTKVEEIEEFIEQHWLIQGLIQIPIQLDAFSFTWAGERESAQRIKSMTTLYTAIEHKLWTKDIPNIRQDISEADVQNIRIWSKLAIRVRDEREFLELFAFTGLYNDMAEFSPGHRDEVYERLPSTNVDDNILEKLSFLRAIDSSISRDKEYYFIHLTFQEYFAARYFVKCWSEGRELTCITLGGDTRFEKADKFIAREKYNGRFDVMWRFITGILELQDEKELLRFMEKLDEPRDLLGPAHARLLMHCFAEITPSGQESGLQNIRAKMARHLTRLLLFEGQMGRGKYGSVLKHPISYVEGPSLLGAAMEFPELIFQSILENGTETHRQIALEVLWRRARVSPMIFEHATAILDGTDWDELKTEAASMVWKNSRRSPKYTIKAIQSKKETIRWGVSGGLQRDPALDPDILLAVLKQFKTSRDWGFKRVLTLQSELPLHIVEDIVSQLKDPIPSIRKDAIEILEDQLQLNKDAVDSVFSLLDDTDETVIMRAAQALWKCNRLPPNCVEDLTSRLESGLLDSESDIYYCVARCLEFQEFLPENILNRIKTLLCEHRARQELWPIIVRHSTLSDEDLLAMFERAKFPDDIALGITQFMFERQEHPPEEILNHSVSLLDSDTPSRILAVHAMSHNYELPQVILNKLFPLFAGSEISLRCAVLRAIAAQHRPPSQFLEVIRPHIEKAASWLFYDDVIEILEKCPTVPDDILEIVVHNVFIKSHLGTYRFPRVQALPESIISSVASQLASEEKKKRERSEKALRKYLKFYSHLEMLDTPYWVSWLQILFQRSFTEGVICYIQDNLLCIEMAEGSFKVSIEHPDQRAKLDAALDAIHKDIEDSLDGFELPGLPSEGGVAAS